MARGQYLAMSKALLSKFYLSDYAAIKNSINWLKLSLA